MTGDIAICRGNRISLYTLNGALLTEQTACESSEESILACMFYEGVNNEWLERELLFTGHKRGVVNVGYPCQVTVWKLISIDLEQGHQQRTV